MNIRDFEYLVAVSEELHFGRAAARCNASQPALSGQLRKLEQRYGVRFFERSTRHVHLTMEGEQFVQRARVILKQIAELETLAETLADPFSGTVSFGMPPTIGPYLIPLLLPALKHYVPELKLEPIEDFTDNLEAQLVSGDLDIAILATVPTHRNLVEIILYEEPFWIAMPGDHPLSRQDTVDVDAIDPGELLLLSDGHCLRDQIHEVCKLNRKFSQDDPGPRTQRTSLSTILSLVGAGSGVTLVPAMSISGAWVTDAGIAIRPEKSGTAGRTVRLAYRQGFPRHVLVEKLADIVAGIVPNTVHPVRR